MFTDPSTTSQAGQFIGELTTQRARHGKTRQLAVLLVHLDRFANASETLGDAPTALLRRLAAARVAALLPEVGVIQWLDAADLGVIVPLPQNAKTGDASRLARQAATSLARPFDLDGFELFLSCSVGIAMDTADMPAEQCLRQAYDAMLQVRKRGGDDILSAQAASPMAHARVMQALPGAVARGELALHLQPRALLTNGDIVGYTMRLRWHSPELGRISPSEFLPALESLSLVGEVANSIVGQASPLLHAGTLPPQVQVGLLINSEQQRATAVMKGLLDAISRHAIPPHRLCVEIGLRSLRRGENSIDPCLDQLRAAGVGIVLNEYGNDPDSADWLSRLRPQLVMLDTRQLGMPSRQREAAARLRLAAQHAIDAGIPVCAKGVETHQQLAEIRSWGCESMQGYLLSQPFPAAWLAQTHMAVQLRARELLGPAAQAGSHARPSASGSSENG